MKTLVLHIGSEKTGSKSIQRSMRLSASHLQKRYGIFYPKDTPLFLRNAHYPIVSPFLDPAELDFVAAGRRLTKAQLGAALEALRRSSPVDTIVLSAEHLSSRLRAPGIESLHEILRETFADYRIRVLYNVRSQTTQYCAALSTHLKTLGIHVESPQAIGSQRNRFLNHYQVASEWAQVFGRENIVIQNYHSHEALSMLYGFLGVDREDRRIRRPLQRNRSLSCEEAKILLALNTAFGKPDFANEPLIKLRRHVQGSLIFYLNSVLGSPTPLTSMLSDDDLAHFRHEFGPSNASLTRHFGLDFDLNDFMDVERSSAPADVPAGDAARAQAELSYWTRQVGSGPIPPEDAERVARRLRNLLIGKHLRHLLGRFGRGLGRPRTRRHPV